MAYTPTIWVDNSAPEINATNLNHLEIGVQAAAATADAAAAARPSGQWKKAAVQSIPTAVSTTLVLDTVDLPVASIFSLNVSTGVVTINQAGWYASRAYVSLNAAGGEKQITISTTAGLVGYGYTSATFSSLIASAVFHANAGDTISAALYQTSGGSLNATPLFSLVQISKD